MPVGRAVGSERQCTGQLVKDGRRAGIHLPNLKFGDSAGGVLSLTEFFQSDRLRVTVRHLDCRGRDLVWAEKLMGAGLWARPPPGLLSESWYCQHELEVTITDVVNLWQSPSVSDRTSM
jgi:hypothetical protein